MDHFDIAPPTSTCMPPSLPPTLSSCAADAADAGERKILLAARLVTPVADHLCRIRIVKPDGVIIECHAPLVVHDRVELELRNRSLLHARIAWARGGRAGLDFDAWVDFDALAHPSRDRADMPPRAPRLSANCAVLLRHAGRSVVPILYNVSQSGCRLVMSAPPPAGSEVKITIPGMAARRAVTRWALADRAGFIFQDMLSFTELSGWQSDYATRFANGAPVEGE